MAKTAAAMISMFPNYGSHYEPAVFAVVIAVMVVIANAVWGPGTLARYRPRDDVRRQS